jgi:hypothetical protein
MTFETRKQNLKVAPAKGSELPRDFLKMVEDVFSTHFADHLTRLSSIQKGPHFVAAGHVFLDEMVLAITLTFKNKLNATTLYASLDYDPQASQPTIQDLLNLAVDGLGATLQVLLPQSETPTEAEYEPWLSQALSDFETGPLFWTQAEIEKRAIWYKLDKANTQLDSLADQWLKKHDPKYQENLEKEQEEVEANSP